MPHPLQQPAWAMTEWEDALAESAIDRIQAALLYNKPTIELFAGEGAALLQRLKIAEASLEALRLAGVCLNPLVS